MPFRLPIRLLCVLALAGVVAAPSLWAQAIPDEPIFRRFTTPPRRADARMRLIEFPVALRPQTDPRAHVDENLGLGYEIGFHPHSRLFGSAAVSVARMQWAASDPEVSSVDIKQMDVTQSLNFRTRGGLIVGVGLGLGVLVSLVVNADSSFEHTVVPYVPFRLGLTLALGDSLYVGLRTVTTPFFGEGHTAGHSRLLLALGWSY